MFFFFNSWKTLFIIIIINNNYEFVNRRLRNKKRKKKKYLKTKRTTLSIYCFYYIARGYLTWNLFKDYKQGKKVETHENYGEYDNLQYRWVDKDGIANKRMKRREVI